MIVLDASAALDFLLRHEPRATWVRTRMLESGVTVHAPHLIDVEVTNVIFRAWRRQLLVADAAREILLYLASLDMTRYPHVQLLERVFELRHSVAAADAMYVALAEALDAPLVTTDQALARTTGHQARIETYPG